MSGTNGWNTHPYGDNTKYEWRLAIVDPNDNPIPVECTLFGSSVDNNQVRLTWTGATETNNSGFEIERAVLTEGT
jgi:hypothetical protein